MRHRWSVVRPHALAALWLLSVPAFAQDPATLTNITSTITGAVKNASVREFCLCQLQPALWGNIDAQVLVDRNATSDNVDRVFRITGGLFYNEESATRPSGLAEYQRNGTVAISSADVAFQRGVPFFVSAPSLQNNGAKLSYTLTSNPAVQLSRAFARYQRITSSSGYTITSETLGTNQPLASSATPQALTWDFSSPVAPVSRQYFAIVNYGQLNGSNLRCLQSNEIDLVALLQGSAPAAITGVSNNASGDVGIASGSWVSIYGTNLSATTRQWQASDFVGNNLPTVLDGVGVKINGKSAALYYVSPGQLNVQAPTDNSVGPVQVEVSNSLGGATGTAILQTYAPGLFTFQGKYAAAVHTDGVYVAPAGYFGSATVSRPAEPGETLLVFGTGFGPTSPAVAAGQIFSGAAPLTDSSQLRISIGGMPATVAFAGIVAAGEYQFNVVVPALPDGDHPIVATVAGVSSQPGLSIPVRTASTVPPSACVSNCVITTSVGRFAVTNAQVGDRFPLGCSPGPGCSTAQSGFQVLVVSLELQGSLTGSTLDLLNPDAYVLAEDGSKTPVSSGGLLSGKYFIAFTPHATLKKFLLNWPGNGPVDLAPFIP